MLSGKDTKNFIKDFKDLLKKYKAELVGYVDPCEEAEYEVWIKDKDPAIKFAYCILKGSYEDISFEDYQDYNEKDDEFWQNSIDYEE